MKNNLKDKALYFLSRRDYGYIELFTKLKKYSLDETQIEVVLKELVAKGWLSEERFIQNYLISKSNKYGLLKLKHDLKQKTSNPELVNQVLAKAAIDELSTAKQLLLKKFGMIASSDYLVRAKQIRFLLNKGFSFGIISRVIKLNE